MKQDAGEILKWAVIGVAVVGAVAWLNNKSSSGPGIFSKIGTGIRDALNKIMPTTYQIIAPDGSTSTHILLPGQTNPIEAKDAAIKAQTSDKGTIDTSKITGGDYLYAALTGKTLPDNGKVNSAGADQIWGEPAQANYDFITSQGVTTK